ncbi:polyribonucleotide nucleotidyltransferase [Candidatus Woesebacteria bacterium RIFCSPLOWO2_01_FULL_39_23]|uniref:Polyribonucleotide nucleotidyltransferase n=2 Tax=Microgenomates group TaxID=1794810 RepID=A0A0H4TNQ1_9BACT|nr:polyribonucleotide nucleotidyltransferase [uncultured Microgenomates bacterium Rifle_16ft_4_minimus_37633]OGM13850.1 MAG: polyribonucleotide nucleotidyltransferase [Candidatus Woesebacteria bacterium RBG_16_40_11]OGM27800.1 MAG: polyribonucleotide nucleotidyltransferase [Candidatus Woesebacteria bacterium RIFCSPHIGHO2_01_FULL_40_22]OGM36088.1 MAG: polyribonucleotide nucleotidyltransferase [Candidatus Woesebacteria bacterium RIFCSPHIGHO2_12_FULL_38_9]OGM62222.1 MAG: polyribonucleotide nucleot
MATNTSSKGRSTSGQKKIEKSVDIGGRKLTISTGNLAGQANAAVLASYGETVVLATVVSSPLKVDLGYFPLTVEYQERLYAGGRIKGSRWVKREGRPTDEEILIGRLIDRSVRPLFPKGYKEDVQLIITLLSVDTENAPETVAGVAASSALAISDIPWAGPIGIVKVGLIEDKFIANPATEDMSKSQLNLTVSSTNEAIVMIEAGGNEVTEETMLKGIEYGQKESQTVIGLINDLVSAVGKEKKAVRYEILNADGQKKVKELAKEAIKSLVAQMATKEADYVAFDAARGSVVANFDDKEKSLVGGYFDDLFKEEVRDVILSGKRPDGRKPDEIRSLSAEVSVLPRTHGSAIFNRGQTQALTIATLGAPSLEQTIESAEGDVNKRYIHHYSMPPFSTGETGRIGSPNRREIGHGALAERALLPVIPAEEDFPYTIRMVTEILSSNGSTSMASTCGSTLALMDAGVPIKKPVAGIAVGLIIEDDKKFAILTDIVGIEDGNGDMDFKVAGTETGITALQLDVKTLSLTSAILGKALEQSKKARIEILSVMNKALGTPRAHVSAHAPKIKIIKIDVEKIGDVIGSGGRTIKGIIATSGAQVDVNDDGRVFISSQTEEATAKAIAQIEGLTKDPLPGEVYDGVVKRVQPFGAFVEILPGREGLVHVSDMREDFVSNPYDVVRVGESVKVRVKEIDELGRLNLSMLLSGDKKTENGGRRRTEFNNFGKYARPQRDDQRRGGMRRNDRRGNYSNFSGPHFPTSRLIDESRKKFDR